MLNQVGRIDWKRLVIGVKLNNFIIRTLCGSFFVYNGLRVKKRLLLSEKLV